MTTSGRRALQPTPFVPTAVRRRRLQWRSGGAAVALAALAGLVLWQRGGDGDLAPAPAEAPAEVVAEAVAAQAAQAAAAQAPAAPPPPPPAPAMAGLRVDSVPRGAHVLLQQRYRGRTPLAISVAPDPRAELWLFHAGHLRAERRLALSAGSTKTLTVTLSAATGTLIIKTDPASAHFAVAGAGGRGPQRAIVLPVGQHAIRVTHEGYLPYRESVRIHPGWTSRRAVSLRRQAVNAEQLLDSVTIKHGLQLRLLRPSNFFMGSRRSERGRRSNEVRQSVTMRRAFYLGVNEVSNAQWRHFDSAHDSGAVSGIRINLDELPVVNISWRQAARYCNWLSRMHSLPPFYAVGDDEALVVADGPQIGYRLPTEAEWSWAIRHMEEPPQRTFPWPGERFPPPDGSGNFADQSAGALTGQRIEAYNDGQAASAPVDFGPTDRNGLRNMAGNVSEWMHDFYQATPPRAVPDPLGPGRGAGHVVRGAHWGAGRQRVLRIAYRDYSEKPRPTLGFRIARWATPTQAPP